MILVHVNICLDFSLIARLPYLLTGKGKYTRLTQEVCSNSVVFYILFLCQRVSNNPIRSRWNSTLGYRIDNQTLYHVTVKAGICLPHYITFFISSLSLSGRVECLTIITKRACALLNSSWLLSLFCDMHRLGDAFKEFPCIIVCCLADRVSGYWPSNASIQEMTYNISACLLSDPVP